MISARTIAIVVHISIAIAACGNPSSETEARPAEPPPELPPPADELEAAIRARAPNEALLMIPHEPPVRGELPEGGSRSFTAVLRAGLCYKVLGQGGAGVADLDLFVYDPHGTLLQRDGTQHEHPVIGVERAICPVEPGLYRVDVEMARGGGPYAVQIWVSQ